MTPKQLRQAMSRLHTMAMSTPGIPPAVLSAEYEVLSAEYSDLMCDDEDNIESKYRAAAYLYANDNLEFDENPEVSIGDYGAWVQAWFWIPKHAMEREIK